MKTFRQYLTEAETKEAGVYASLQLDDESREKIHKWLKNHEVSEDLDDPEDYHCTVVYSKKPVPELKSYEPELPITTTIKGWHVFPTQDDSKCLVLDVDDPKLQEMFEDTQEMGATWDFPEYKPHITVVAKGYKGDAPKSHPKFKIKFISFGVEDLKD